MGEITWQSLQAHCHVHSIPKKLGDLRCWPAYRTDCLMGSVSMKLGDHDCLPAHLPVGQTSIPLSSNIMVSSSRVTHSNSVCWSYLWGKTRNCQWVDTIKLRENFLLSLLNIILFHAWAILTEIILVKEERKIWSVSIFSDTVSSWPEHMLWFPVLAVYTSWPCQRATMHWLVKDISQYPFMKPIPCQDSSFNASVSFSSFLMSDHT